MIEKMKKITLLVSEKDRGEFISRLRRTGVVHVRHVTRPVHHEINFIEEKISKIEQMLSVLAPYAEKGQQDWRASSREKDVLGKVEEITQADREKQDLLSLSRDVENKIQWFGAWGEFYPEDVSSLREKRVYINLYRLNRQEFKNLEKDVPHIVIGRERGYVRIATVYMGQEQVLPFKQVTLPEAGPAKLRHQTDGISKRIGEREGFLKEQARSAEAMKKCLKKLKKEHEALLIKFGMREEDAFSFLQGFCPEKALDKIRSLAEQNDLGYLLEDPDDPDETPTLITNPKWVKIIDPVFRFMNTLPGYKEFDISFLFLMFFSLFFAMLIGDAGYGLLFFLVTFFVRRRFRDLPAEPFLLMYVLSAGTVVWGVITGTYFGVEKIAQLPFLNILVIHKISSFAESSQNAVIFICFVIGAAQLTIAHLMRAVKVINSIIALAQVGWVFILWGMFFAAGKFVIGNAFPAFAGWFLIAGICLVLFFTNPKKGFFKGAIITMASLPLSVISSFSDIVSYLRLFAVGYATVVMAESFNNLALGGGINSVIGGVAAAVILFLGHTLNIILGFMAVIVHGIRLNMLEFSNHLGMQWSGSKYEPFCENPET
ncbi:MAG: hypothetical protein U9R44_04600 [Candidatus Omnitrophota bacterium]|nr:hypothetical protein [Candidatus Omnitrophota bacterium]